MRCHNAFFEAEKNKMVLLSTLSGHMFRNIIFQEISRHFLSFITTQCFLWLKPKSSVIIHG